MVARGQGVADRLDRHGVAGVPVAGATMQLGDAFAVAAAQLALQQLGKKVVIAIPAPLVVQRNEEEVGRQQPLQQRRAAGQPGDCVAQVAAEPRQDRGVQQELLHAAGWRASTSSVR